MNLRSLPRFGPALALLVLVLPGCASVLEQVQGMARPSARVTGASLGSVSLDEVTVDFEILVENPASVPLPLVDLSYDLESSGRPFLSGRTGVPGSVPAQGERTVTLPVVVGLPQALDVLTDLRPGAILPYRASLELQVDAPMLGLLTLPLSHVGELPVPDVPRVNLVSVDWTELSLSRVSGTARLGVRNPNDFVIELTRLAGDLQLGGRRVGELSAAPGAELGQGASSVLELPLAFAPLDLGAGLLDLVRGGESGYEINGQLGLDTRFGAFELPYRSSGTVPFQR